jgi:L-lactate dehydrogenase
LPVILGRKGIIRTIQIPLNNDEQAHITESAKSLRGTLDRIKSDQYAEMT